MYRLISEIMSSCVVTALIAMAFTRQTHANIQFTKLPNWHVAVEYLLNSGNQTQGTRNMKFNMLIFLSLCKTYLKQSMKIMKNFSPRIQNSCLSSRVYTCQQCESVHATRISQHLLLSNNHKPHFLLPRVNAGLREGP